ncbi:MAG TPA: efflux transporter outer membrane subunit [Pyrinomonadaceae bacterium]|jgi:NodT family efflux transporter outer membrane factor (OMF) lipoprotein
MRSLKALPSCALFVLLLSASAASLTAQSKKQKQIKKPRVEVPETWSTSPTEGVSPQVAQLKDWWKNFQDPQLDRLVEQALIANTDLNIADARINEVRAMHGIANSARYPTIEQSDVITRRRTVVQTPKSIGAVEGGLFQIGFDANWELDFFGGVRNSVKAATAEVIAAEESRRDVMVTVIAEVARNYIALRGYQRQLEVARSNIATQRDTSDLTAVRAKAGLATELDVSRAEAQLALTEAVVPELESLIANTAHRLGVLLGKQPGALLSDLQAVEPIPATPREVPVGLPSELLRRRPDVRRAEAEIIAQTAKLGVAKSELYPKFQLTGLLGRTATSLGGLTLGLGNFFSIGPGIKLPIFNHGRIRSNIKAQDARLDQAILVYEDTWRHSLEDVDNSLTSYEREREQRAILAKAVASNRRSVELAKELYTAGLSDFLSVLEAEKELYNSENELAQSEAAASVNLVALYKALGGGW